MGSVLLSPLCSPLHPSFFLHPFPFMQSTEWGRCSCDCILWSHIKGPLSQTSGGGPGETRPVTEQHRGASSLQNGQIKRQSAQLPCCHLWVQRLIFHWQHLSERSINSYCCKGELAHQHTLNFLPTESLTGRDIYHWEASHIQMELRLGSPLPANLELYSFCAQANADTRSNRCMQ